MPSLNDIMEKMPYCIYRPYEWLRYDMQIYMETRYFFQRNWWRLKNLYAVLWLCNHDKGYKWKDFCSAYDGYYPQFKNQEWSKDMRGVLGQWSEPSYYEGECDWWCAWCIYTEIKHWSSLTREDIAEMCASIDDYDEGV